MDNKADFINRYQELKKANNGEKPLYKDFLIYCKVHKRKLEAVFGRDAYTKLQEECGDKPNKLHMQRTPIKNILEQYGQLVRDVNQLPVTSDWIFAKLKPSPDAINKIHGLKWGDMPIAFVKEFGDRPEWKTVIEILQKPELSIKSKPHKDFNTIVERIVNWTPDRRRIIEEGYKIELRNYLERFFNLEEEVGESNPDLLLDKKFPIEVKKDPSQSEYDRLLGQMIRHNKIFGSAIAVVTSVSSEDRFRKFQKLFIEVHDKLEMTAELIKK